jgi:hypothetical protein
VSEALFGLVLTLAWFAATNVAASLVAWVLWRLVAGTRLVGHPARAARVFLALRLLPAAASLFFTVALFLPAHWRLEPAGAEESAGYSLVLFALVGAALLGITVGRAVRDTRATASVVRRWSAAGRSCPPRPSFGIPVFGVADTSPVLSLVGVVRPRLFVADDVVGALTAEELDVSLAHEAAHDRARDNLKRLVVAWCPDALGACGLGNGLIAGWHAAMEFAADARAAAGSERRAVALASALVKVARLTPPRAAPVPAASRLHDDALLAARIERLLAPAGDLPAPGDIRSPWPLAAAAVLALAILLPAPHAWLAVHEVTEGLVRLLP